MKLIKKVKKGFTLVELVVVIAVVAILAAISAITFVSVTNNARKSNDISALATLNKGLIAGETLYSKPVTMQKAIDLLDDVAGISNPEKFLKCQNPSYTFAYDLEFNRFVLLENDKISEYSQDKKAEYEASGLLGNSFNQNKVRFWKIIKTIEQAETSEYSVYFAEGATLDRDFTASVGVDFGVNEFEHTFTYQNISEKAQTTVLNTASLEMDLVLNAPNDVVDHYGPCGSADIVEAATASYHVHGQIPFVEIAKGRIALEKGADVDKLWFNAKTQEEFDNIIVAKDPSVERPEFGRDEVIIADDGTLVVELQSDTKNDANTESDYMYLYKQGVISQIVVTEEKVDGIHQDEESGKFYGYTKDSTTEAKTDIEEVELGIAGKDQETQEAALEIANNYTGSYGSIQTVGGQENVNVPELDENGDIKDEDKTAAVTEGGLNAEKKEIEKEKTTSAAIEEANKAIAECLVGSASMDFADAIAMAQDNTPIEIKINKTIYIKGNDGITISKNKIITIDLNGWTIIGQFDEKRDGKVFTNHGTLTIKDTSAEQNGKITDTGLTLDEAGNWYTDPKRNYADNVFNNYGTLTLESGTIEQGINGNIVYCVDNYSGATFNMTGGHLYNYNTATVRMFCNSTTVDNIVNISGGLIEGYQGVWVQNPSGTKTVGGLKDKGHLNISGGTFNVLGSGTDAIYSFEAYYGASPDDNGNYYDCSEIYVNITGGVFNSKIHVYKCSGDSSKNVNLAISGGSFIANTQKTSNESYISLGGGYYYYEPSSDRWVYYYFGDDTYKAGWYYYSGDFIADCAAIGYTVSADQDYMYVTPSKVEGMIAGATVNLENGYLVVSMEN